jgi:hypothetical protein
MKTEENEVNYITGSKSYPYLPNHDKFMCGDKVRDIRGGDTQRVVARFAIKWVDYITFRNVINDQEQTALYWDILPYLELVAKSKSY